MRASSRRRRRTCWSGSARRTTRPCTSSTTSARSSSRSTSFRPSSTIPRDFGAIAAANALNDVFAMGGSPLLALSVAAFPEELPTSVLAEVLARRRRDRSRRGGAACRRAHDPRRRAEVRTGGRRHRASRRVWAKSTRGAGRRALPHEAARHGSCAARAEARARRRRRSSRKRCAGCGCSTARPRRPFVRSRRARSPTSPGSGCSAMRTRRRRAAACGSCSMPARCLRSRGRSTSCAQAEVKRAATAAIGSSRASTSMSRKACRRCRRARLGSADLGRPSRLRCRKSAAPCCRRRSTPPASFVARIGIVEEGSGVELRAGVDWTDGRRAPPRVPALAQPPRPRDGLSGLERRRPGRVARSPAPRHARGTPRSSRTSIPRASSTSRRRGRGSLSSTASRATSTGRRTTSSTRALVGEQTSSCCVGTEPNVRWRTFTELVVDLAQDLGIELVVSLGALLADVPHTRPAPVTGAGSDPGARRAARSPGLTLRGPDGDRRRAPRRMPGGRACLR